MAAAKMKASPRKSKKARLWKKEATRQSPIDVRKCRAFDEFKSILSWTKDRWCKVVFHTLHKRLEEGRDPEKAITTPGRRKVRAFGCTKTVTGRSAPETGRTG